MPVIKFIKNFSIENRFNESFGLQEMTLEEYEKVLAEKRKALEALSKTEERKVTLDKDLESMQLIERKKDDSLFIKLVCRLVCLVFLSFLLFTCYVCGSMSFFLMLIRSLRRRSLRRKVALKRMTEFGR